MSEPSDRALAWAAAQLDADQIVGAVGLHDGGSPWRLNYRTGQDTRQVILRIADGDRVWGPAIVRAAAGLAVAGEHELPTARLIALDPDGGSAGDPALIETYLGESTAPTRQALPSAGAVLAAHAIHLKPTTELPIVRHHTPPDGHPTDRHWARRYRTATAADREEVLADFLRACTWMTRAKGVDRLANTPTSPLLEDAADRIATIPAPEGDSFLHGDVWLGNMYWQDGTCYGLLDWKSAGVGHSGADLGSLRMRATFALGRPPLTRPPPDGNKHLGTPRTRSHTVTSSQPYIRLRRRTPRLGMNS